MKERKVIQIATAAGESEGNTIVALCDDGTIWEITENIPIWGQVPAIPQPETN